MPGFEIIGNEEFLQIKELFDSQNVCLYRYAKKDSKVSELEEQFATYMGVKYAHAVSSGTAAIHCALSSIGVEPGDEVITTSFTFIAPIEAIASLGAIPVPVDIDETYHLDPKEVEKAITDKTKAVVSIPMWAAPKMNELTNICNMNNLILVEDSAQCLGGKYNGKKLGTFGKVGSFSFDWGKTITTSEGGMVITNDKEIYDKAAEFSDHGHMHLNEFPRGKDPRRKPGLNYRMSELSGAMGVAQLKKIDFILDKAIQIKSKLKNKLKNVPNIKFREFTDEEGAIGHMLIFKLDSEEIAKYVDEFLSKNGLSTSILPEAFDWHFAGSWNHLLPQYSYFNDIDLNKKFKKSANLLKSSIGIFISLNLDDKKIDKFVSVIKEALVTYNQGEK